MTVAVVGLGRTAYLRSSGRTTGAMAAEASRQAIADAGLTSADVDGVGCFGFNNDTTWSAEVARQIGADEVNWLLDMSGGGNVTVALVRSAALAIEAGHCTTAVVYRSLNGRSGTRLSQGSSFTASGKAEFNLPNGYATPAQWMAMWTRVHQHKYGSTSADLGAIAVTQRCHAVPNEHAAARTPLTIDEYMESRWIAEPLRLYDCTFEVDGACAIVLTTLERARHLPHPPVVLRGSVDFTGGGGSWDQWPDPSEMFSARIADRLWSVSGVEPADVDLACIYDCFTYTVMSVLEDLGFCDKGEIGDFFREGRGTYGGDVVVNPHGGLLSEGYIHGLNHHFEAALQLRHEAGQRQVHDAEVALVTSGAGPLGGGMIYTKDT